MAPYQKMSTKKIRQIIDHPNFTPSKDVWNLAMEVLDRRTKEEEKKLKSKPKSD